MSRYPFTDCLNEYMPLEYGHIASSTYATTRRKLVQLGKIFHELKQDGRTSTDNPRKITAKDIDAFVGYRKANGVVDATVRGVIRGDVSAVLDTGNISELPPDGDDSGTEEGTHETE